jgi:hypothetical protein
MTGWIGRDELRRLKDHELYGLRKLLYRALTCPNTEAADLPAIRATLAAIEAELGWRCQAPAPAP